MHDFFKSNPKIAITRIKCPKCKSRSFYIHEVFEEIVTCEVVDGVLAFGALDRDAGAILGLSCECRKCGHLWRPRNVRQLWDIVLSAANGEKP